MRDDEIADLPLWRLSEMVRSREITSTRLTRIYLERITTYDEGLPINSYITVAREAALAQAAEADAVIESGKPLGPRASGPPGGRKSSLPIFPYGTPLSSRS
jgi:Asp-tRNA(Asn)/Glu-tRNA(Gln) amidotransferase A subunit family amidase